MEPIIWSDQFSVGVTLFDEQHKRLLSMLNKMIKEPEVKTGSETVSDVLNAMTSYAQEHFRAEELLMAEYSYPLLEEHKRQHLEFKKEVVQLCSATIVGVEAVPQVILAFLGQWLAKHILQEDMAYKKFFAGKDVH